MCRLTLSALENLHFQKVRSWVKELRSISLTAHTVEYTSWIQCIRSEGNTYSRATAFHVFSASLFNKYHG